MRCNTELKIKALYIEKTKEITLILLVIYINN